MDNPPLGADVVRGPSEQFLLRTEGLDSSELIKASARLIDLTNSLNLEDCDKMLPFLSYPFVNDFERLSARICEARKIYEGYSLDNPFDGQIFGKMRVLAHQLAPRLNAFVAYCELKSQLCLEENEFFFEVHARVEDRIGSCTSEVERARLLSAIWRIGNICDVPV